TIADHVGANDHVLDQEILIALEARAGRHRDLHDPILVHAQIGSTAPAAAPLAPTLLRRRVPARLLHPARLDRWGTFEAFEAGELPGHPRDRVVQPGVPPHHRDPP